MFSWQRLVSVPQRFNLQSKIGENIYIKLTVLHNLAEVYIIY